MEYTGKKKNITRMNKEMPILMISGERDAVGKFKKGVEGLRKKYGKVGMKRVEVKFFEGMRHDVLHEIKCESVYAEVLNFLLSH